MAEQANTGKEKGLWNWIKRFLNGWTIAGLVIVVFIVFGGENTVFTNIEDHRIIDSLENRLQSIRDSTEYYRRLNQRLLTDPSMMEQVVREQYKMQKVTEDAFVFDENPTPN